MKILSLNTWQERGPWEKRWEVIRKETKLLKPDLVAFQELFNPEWASQVQAQLSYAEMILSEAHWGLVVMTNDNLLESGECRLPQSPMEEYSRGFIWGRFKRDDWTYWVLCTHFSWIPEDSATRLSQAKILGEFIRTKACNEPVFVMGDLNAAPDTLEIKALLADAQLNDLYVTLHGEKPMFTWDNQNPYAKSAHHDLPDRRIDYILAGNIANLSTQLCCFERVLEQPNEEGIYGSDHFGVLAKIKIKS